MPKKWNVSQQVAASSRNEDDDQERPLNRTQHEKPARKRNPFFDRFRKKKKPKIKLPKPKRKIYRKTKRLRPCALQAIFFVPICILLFERYLGMLLKAEHVTDFYYEQSGLEPWKIDHSISDTISMPPDIFNLTSPLSPMQCPKDLRKVTRSTNRRFQPFTRSRKIPMTIHQSSRSRCLTMNFHRASLKWAELRHWSFFFHDDNAVDRLLQSSFPEFPHLNLIAKNCAIPRSMKVDLWKYLVLWSYGGVVADLNSYPDKFHSNTIDGSDDGFFLLDQGMLSTTLMAVSRRHPIMYYAVQYSLTNILKDENIGNKDTAAVTGRAALDKALNSFRVSKEQGQRIITGKVDDFDGRSIRIVSAADSYTTPIFISEQGEKKELLKMGIDVTSEAQAMGDCFREIQSNMRFHGQENTENENR